MTTLYVAVVGRTAIGIGAGGTENGPAQARANGLENLTAARIGEAHVMARESTVRVASCEAAKALVAFGMPCPWPVPLSAYSGDDIADFQVGPRW